MVVLVNIKELLVFPLPTGKALVNVVSRGALYVWLSRHQGLCVTFPNVKNQPLSVLLQRITWK